MILSSFSIFNWSVRLMFKSFIFILIIELKKENVI